MSAPRYVWRQLTDEQRAELLALRRDRGVPWHSPPHRPNFGHMNFLVTGTCYEHRHNIGRSPQRMDAFSRDLLAVIGSGTNRVVAWCVLPNHYHVLVEAPDILKLLDEVGRLHGQTSFQWNGEEEERGRKVFFRCTERFMRSERHFFATINYVHHNPVHHGYVERCWYWSSAQEYLGEVGRSEAARIWQSYPIQEYGEKWDGADL